MIDVAAELVLLGYAFVTLFFLSAAISYEHDQKYSEYTEAVLISVLWPVMFVTWMYIRFK